MQCQNCQGQLDESQKFCRGCGSPVSQTGPETEVSVDPLLGTTLGGRFRIIKLLGEGGMGAVYLGEQQLGTNARKVAVKTLHPHLSKDTKVLARFERECGTISELEHPNTIQVFDFGKTDAGLLYIVMEFVQGNSLADLLEKGGAMDPLRVEAIMKQIGGSLEEAHARGIVHRDLKPDNIVLTERAGTKDFVKVLDFGIAKRSGEEDKNEQKLTQQGMVLGTPPYMSPEQFTGQPIDARSDIYSLAVMAYEMVTGSLPFRANTAWEWATQHMTAPPLPLEPKPGQPAVPPRMKAAIFRALQKSPDQRFANVHDFVDAFVGAVPIAGPSPTVAQGVRHPPTDYQGAPIMTPGPNAMMPPGSDPRGNTQAGGPMMTPQPQAAYGAAYASGPMAQQPMPPMQAGGYAYGTPPAGNHAFPTPPVGNLAYPMPPQMPPPRRGASPLIFLALGIAVLSGVAIFFALHGRTSASTPSPTVAATFDNPPLTTVVIPTATVAPSASIDPSIAALNAAPAHTATATAAPTTPKPTPTTGPMTPIATAAPTHGPVDMHTQRACDDARRFAMHQGGGILSQQILGEARRRCTQGGGTY